MNAPFDYLTINKALMILMRRVLRLELEGLDREASLKRLQEVVPDFQEMMLKSLQAGALHCTAFDDESGKATEVTTEFWHSQNALNSLRLGKINLMPIQANGSGNARTARIFVFEETFSLLLEQIDIDLIELEAAHPKSSASKSVKSDEMVLPAHPQGASQRKRGPKNLTHQRICADMRLIPTAELQGMLYKQMEDRFGAAGSTCEIARKAVLAERSIEISPNSNNR